MTDRSYTRRGSRSLGDLVRDGIKLAVSCLYCRHFKQVDPADLAARLGYDYAVPDVHRRMRCSACGSRRVDVRVGEVE